MPQVSSFSTAATARYPSLSLAAHPTRRYLALPREVATALRVVAQQRGLPPGQLVADTLDVLRGVGRTVGPGSAAPVERRAA